MAPKPISARVCRLIVVHQGEAWRRALEICVKNRNVYVHHFDRQGHKVAHISHHATGRQHIKKNGQYVYWTGGPTGKMEPMAFPKAPPAEVVGRETVTGMGWAVDTVVAELPDVSPEAATVVLELPADLDADLLYFEVSIVGPQARERQEVNGFHVIWRDRFAHGVTVEVEAVAVRQGKK